VELPTFNLANPNWCTGNTPDELSLQKKVGQEVLQTGKVIKYKNKLSHLKNFLKLLDSPNKSFILMNINREIYSKNILVIKKRFCFREK
jgi:heterodisulfide reductase subunit C